MKSALLVTRRENFMKRKLTSWVIISNVRSAISYDESYGVLFIHSVGFFCTCILFGGIIETKCCFNGSSLRIYKIEV